MGDHEHAELQFQRATNPHGRSEQPRTVMVSRPSQPHADQGIINQDAMISTRLKAGDPTHAAKVLTGLAFPLEPAEAQGVKQYEPLMEYDSPSYVNSENAIGPTRTVTGTFGGMTAAEVAGCRFAGLAQTEFNPDVQDQMADVITMALSGKTTFMNSSPNTLHPQDCFRYGIPSCRVGANNKSLTSSAVEYERAAPAFRPQVIVVPPCGAFEVLFHMMANAEDHKAKSLDTLFRRGDDANLNKLEHWSTATLLALTEIDAGVTADQIGIRAAVRMMQVLCAAAKRDGQTLLGTEVGKTLAYFGSDNMSLAHLGSHDTTADVLKDSIDKHAAAHNDPAHFLELVQIGAWGLPLMAARAATDEVRYTALAANGESLATVSSGTAGECML